MKNFKSWGLGLGLGLAGLLVLADTTVVTQVLGVTGKPFRWTSLATGVESSYPVLTQIAVEVSPDTAPWTITSYPAGYTGPYNGRGDVVVNVSVGETLPAGSYEVSFGAVPGYTAPQPVTELVQSGVPVVFRGVYNQFPSITEGAIRLVTMSEDGAPTAFSLTLHATDAENDALSWSVQTQAQLGQATAQGDGTTRTVQYQPNPNANGSDQFVVSVTDAQGGYDTIQINVNILPVNDAPVMSAVPDQTVDEGGVLTVQLSATDVDGDTLLFGKGTGPGSVAGDVYRYAPDFSSAAGSPYSVTVGVSDGNAVAGVNFLVTVNDVNRPPEITAIPDYTMKETGTLNTQLKATDPDADPVTFSLLSGPGEVAGTSYTYTPAAGAAAGGPYDVRIRASDGRGGQAEALFVVTVQPEDARDPVILHQSLTGAGGCWRVAPDGSVLEPESSWSLPSQLALRDIDGSKLLGQYAGTAGVLLTLSAERTIQPQSITIINVQAGWLFRSFDQGLALLQAGDGGAVYVASVSETGELTSQKLLSVAIPNLIARSLDGRRVLAQLGNGGPTFVATFNAQWSLAGLLAIRLPPVAGLICRSLDGNQLLVQLGETGPAAVLTLWEDGTTSLSAMVANPTARKILSLDRD